MTTGASSERWTTACVIALLVITPLVIDPAAKESFRAIKVLVASWLALLSLTVAAVATPTRTLSIAALRARPLVRALWPLLGVILLGVAWTRHPWHFRDAAADTVIGAAAVVGWSLALSSAALQRAIWWSTAASVVVAALTLDQALGLVGLLDGLAVTAPTARLALTSTLGNPGDVGASLVLPLVWVMARWPEVDRRWRPALFLGAFLLVAALLASGTLAAVVAVAVGAMVLAVRRTPQTHRRAMLALAMAALVGASLLPPIQARLARLADAVRAGDMNAVLTGRLDGWRAAVEMTRQHPWTGVGHGGFVAEYAETRLALMDRGTSFYREQTQVMFDTPHNEYLGVAAAQGWPGVLALAWAVWCVGSATRRVPAGRERDVAVVGLVALGTLALAWFPLHVAAVAWPWLTFLAWLDRTATEAR